MQMAPIFRYKVALVFTCRLLATPTLSVLLRTCIYPCRIVLLPRSCEIRSVKELLSSRTSGVRPFFFSTRCSRDSGTVKSALKVEQHIFGRLFPDQHLSEKNKLFCSVLATSLFQKYDKTFLLNTNIRKFLIFRDKLVYAN